MDKKVGKIYIIKNFINDKVYIGQTITPLKIRWKNHQSNARHIKDNIKNQGMIIYWAMYKYGIENFYVELVEDNIPIEMLNDREDYWIDYFNSLRPNGYNIYKNSERPTAFRRKAIYQLNKNTLEIINKFESESEAEEITGIRADYISRVIRKVCLTTGGYRWCLCSEYEEYKNNPPINANGKNYIDKKNKTKHQPTKVILQIDPNTNEVIKEWYNGAIEIAKIIKKAPSGIYGVIRGDRKTCGGYVWKYKNQ